MKFSKRFHRLISFVLSLTLIFQTFTPAVVYATDGDTATPSATTQAPTPTPTAAPTETVTPTPPPPNEATPSATAAPTLTPSPEATSTPTVTISPIQPTKDDNIWTEIDSNTLTTKDNVAENTDYHFRDPKVVVHFTKVTKSGKLTIREIKLTPKQVVATGALSDTAYDITSDMENGSFIYDLTLPLPKNDPNTKVKFADNTDSIEHSQVVANDTSKNNDTIQVRGLNHFTVFFVTNVQDKATNGSWCELTPNCSIDTNLSVLQNVDSTFLDIKDNLGDKPGFWPNKDFDENYYVEFRFDPKLEKLPSTATFKIVYKTNKIDSSEGHPFGAKLIIDKNGEMVIVTEDKSVIGPTGNDSLQTYSLSLPLDQLGLDTLNHLKVRFFMFGDPADNEAGITTSFDQVILLTDSDDIPPTGSITSPNKKYYHTQPEISADASDNQAIASVKFQYRSESDEDFLDLNTSTKSPYVGDWGDVVLKTNIHYHLRAIIKDTAGNETTTDTVNFLFDNVPPAIVYNNPVGGATVWYKDNPLLDIDFIWGGGSPLDYAKYRLDDGIYKNIFSKDRSSDYTKDWDISGWTGLGEGPHPLDLKVRDKASNTRVDNYDGESRGLNLGKDTTPPSSFVKSPSYTNTSPVHLTFTASDDHSGVKNVTLWYRVDTGDGYSGWTNSGFISTEGDSFDFHPKTEGTYQFYTIATDTAGNVEKSPNSEDETISYDSQTIYDQTKAISLISSPPNDGSGGTIYTNHWDGSVSGTASDNRSGLDHVELSIQRSSDGKYFDGDTWRNFDGEGTKPRVNASGTGNWNYSLTLPTEDSYDFVSHAVDKATNVESSYKLKIVYDKTIPEVTLTLNPTTADSGNGWYKTEPTATLTATDNTATDHIEYQWDSTSGTWTAYSLPFKTPGEGSHTLYYRAFDKAGNVSDTGTKNIKYDKTDLTNGPLNVSVSPNPTSGHTATVKWDAAIDNVGIDKYEINWSLDGTSTSYTDTVGNDIRDHEINKLDQEGKWNVTVTAFDSAGNHKAGSTELAVDRTSTVPPRLALGGTGVGTATLTWNKIADANDYILWYGNVPGTYLYGARTGNADNFTIKGLGGGNYYFVIQSVDNAGNRSGNSNEVNTQTIVGAPGVLPGAPAEGFTPQIKGSVTTETPTPSVSPTNQNNFPRWLIILLIATGGFGALFYFHRD